MFVKKIEDNTYLLTMNVDKMKFESMWELPNGVTLNSYIVKGKDIAIIDGVIGWNGVPEDLYKNFAKLDINPKDIKYLVVNHMEPDHSGWIENFRKINDDFTIITTAKGKDLVSAFYGENFNVSVVKEGDTLDLGNGKVLHFYPTPNVHWPETMITYEESTKILFTCDLYGAFGSLNDHYFDDEMTEEEIELYELEGARYFSNVMMTFASMVQRAIAKTKTLDVAMIAPGHGPLYKNPDTIINNYSTWSDYANGTGKKRVSILWGSMYGSTEQAVILAKQTLEEKGVEVKMLHLPYDEETDVLTNVLTSAGVIIAAPTYEYKMFAPVAHSLDELGRKKMTGKTALYFGSYGWSGGAKKELDSIIENYRMNWNVVDSVEFNGFSREKDNKAIQDGIQKLLDAMKVKVQE